MKEKVFSFIKPSENSKIPSAGIARTLAQVTGAELTWGDDVADGRIDVLYLVNGAFAFCKSLEAVGEAVLKARRVVWVQNDYTIVPPKAESNAESPFRAAFRLRRQRRRPDMDYWTTIKEHAELTPLSHYINWNALTYDPVPLARRSYSGSRPNSLLYYGSYRRLREPYFDRFFMAPFCKTVVASSAHEKFRERYERVTVIPAIDQIGFMVYLTTHGAGLYIEDPKSHEQFHSPANRFYEMLSAGLPMMFQEEAIPRLKEAGFDVAPYAVRNRRDVKEFFQNREWFGREQFERWGRGKNHHGVLFEEVKKAHRRLRSNVGGK